MAASHETLERTRIAAEAARQLKATDITAIDVSERLVLTEAFLIVSGSSQRQVRALVDGIEEALAKVGIERERREGFGEEIHWVLVDFGDFIVHVLPDEDREFYALDRLWGDCPAIDLGADGEPRLEDDGGPGADSFGRGVGASGADIEAAGADVGQGLGAGAGADLGAGASTGLGAGADPGAGTPADSGGFAGAGETVAGVES